ncbi:hypothetical protein NQ315_016792, partial [Exocentrus adspersus]
AFGNYVPEFRSKTGKALFIVYSVIYVGVVYVGMLTSEVVNVLMVLDDLQKVTEASFLTLTHLVQVSKFYYLYKYNKRVRKLVRAINRKEFQPKNQKQYVKLKSYVQTSKAITRYFLWACVVTCTFWSLYPLTVKGELFLPLAGWFPFDTSHSPVFEAVYVYQAVGSLLNGLSNISVDTLMSATLPQHYNYLHRPGNSNVNNLIVIAGAGMMKPPFDVKEMVTLNLRVLNFFGYIAPESGPDAYFVVRSTVFLGLLYLGTLASEIVNMVLVAGDIEKMTEASFLTLTNLVEICKVYAVIKHRRRLNNLLESINREQFQPRSLVQVQTLTDYVYWSKLTSKVFLSACVATCTFWAVYPYVDEGDLRLPLAAWFPFATKASPGFEIAYLYQFIGSTVNGLVNVSLDTFMSGLIMVVCAQLNILNDSLRNLRLYAKDELKGEGMIVGELMTEQLQAKMDEKLVECVVHHRFIIEFANELTFLFTTSILGQFIVSVVIICITLFEITLLPLMSIKFISLILYQFCMLLEIFLLCYYGNEVIRESTELTQFAYCSDWMDCSSGFKRNLIYFMTRSQMALKLYAGGFFTLSLETFMKAKAATAFIGCLFNALCFFRS